MSNRNDSDRSSEQFRKLFIGGLSFVTNEDALKSHFEQWGELVDVVVMRIGGKNGKSRGFGFVTYKDPDMVDAAQASRPHIIDNRTVETKRAMPRDEANSAESHMTVKKLFVGALKKEVVADDLRDYFAQFGNIIDCEIITWRETGESRGFGFVTFDDYDPVDKILLLKPHHIDRKRCEVKKALSKEEARSLKEKEESMNSVGKSKFSQMSQSNGGMMGRVIDLIVALNSDYIL